MKIVWQSLQRKRMLRGSSRIHQRRRMRMREMLPQTGQLGLVVIFAIRSVPSDCIS